MPEVILDADEYFLPKFDIYQSIVSQLFSEPQTLLCSDFFQKTVLPDVRSEILLARRNTASTR